MVVVVHKWQGRYSACRIYSHFLDKRSGCSVGIGLVHSMQCRSLGGTLLAKWIDATLDGVEMRVDYPREVDPGDLGLSEKYYH